MRFRQIAAFAAVCLAGACQTVSQDVAFEEPSDQAFAFVGGGEMSPDAPFWIYSIIFQRVDLATSTFQSDSFELTFNGIDLSSMPTEFAKPEGLETSARFAGRKTPPGDYALIFRSEESPGGYGGRLTTEICYAKRAPVYRLEAGAINLIWVASRDLIDKEMALRLLIRRDLESADNNEASLSENLVDLLVAATDDSGMAEISEAVLAAHPNMTARREVAKIVGTLSVPMGRNIFGKKTCTRKGPFEFEGKSDVPAQTDDPGA